MYSIIILLYFINSRMTGFAYMNMSGCSGGINGSDNDKSLW